MCIRDSHGEDGDDRIFGRDGNVIIYGGNGNDLLRGLEGIDQVFGEDGDDTFVFTCLLYTSPSPRDRTRARMPSSA